MLSPSRLARSDPSLYYNVSSPQLGPLYQCISAHACLEHAAVYHCMHEVRGDHIHVHCSVNLQEFVNLRVVGPMPFLRNTKSVVQILKTTRKKVPAVCNNLLVLPLVFALFCFIDILCMPACAAHLYSNCSKASSLYCAGAVQTVVIPRCHAAVARN